MRIVAPILLALAACGPGQEPPLAAPGAPVARLVLPRFGAPAEALPADAGRSLSPGGALTHYRFTFGDGTAQADSGTPRLLHAYAQEGIYDVALEVQDAQGRTARAQGQLAVRQSPPACTADAECDAPDVCTASRCTATWGPP